MSTITVHAPARVEIPRGSSLAAAGFVRLLAWLERMAQAQRERRERREVAEHVSEANRVRAFAQQVMCDDPRFAADLFAAADRHDRY